ncbi:MAG: aminoacetone oxidase family FAD-binding enzyme [Longibaculum sp.]
MRRIVIVGAGASGVYLSILLKQKMDNLEVIVLEQNKTSLKKVLATGNGRCNLSHRNIEKTCYQSDGLEIVEKIVHSFDMQEKMNELGLYCIYQGDLLYPKSEQALSVKQILMQRAEELGVLFFYEQEVLSIDYTSQYVIKTNHQSFKADGVVFAMGSEAGKLSGVNMSRYDILKKLHLYVVDSTPSLVQFNTSPVFKQFKGVRVKGTFSLLEKGKCIHQEKGELLFTDYGVSGIAVMQLSAYFQNGHQYQLSIDFFDEEDEKKLYQDIELRLKKGYNHFYDGLIHQKIAQYFETLPHQKASQIVRLLKDFRIDVKGVRDFTTAQVMKGGLSFFEVDENLQIQKYPHMYAIGEILNVAGLCGGYNLHFAFASAYCVACAMEREWNVKNT